MKYDIRRKKLWKRRGGGFNPFDSTQARLSYSPLADQLFQIADHHSIRATKHEALPEIFHFVKNNGFIRIGNEATTLQGKETGVWSVNDNGVSCAVMVGEKPNEGHRDVVIATTSKVNGQTVMEVKVGKEDYYSGLTQFSNTYELTAQGSQVIINQIQPYSGMKMLDNNGNFFRHELSLIFGDYNTPLPYLLTCLTDVIGAATYGQRFNIDPTRHPFIHLLPRGDFGQHTPSDGVDPKSPLEDDLRRSGRTIVDSTVTYV